MAQPPTTDSTPPLAHTDWTLWSTTARLVVSDPAALEPATELADHLLGEIDAASSRFRDDSELSRAASSLPQGVPVSDLLARLVSIALQAAVVTDGDVDPTLGYAMDAVGYDRDIRLVTTEGPDATLVRAIVSPRPGWRSVTLVDGRLRVPGYLALDLGATAKAYAADLVATAIFHRFGCSVLLSLGGDIATAGPEPTGGWNVLVQDVAEDPSSTIRLLAGHALATSSTQKRTWLKGGVTRHHILDPATGLPADPYWKTVTVAAPTCVRANTLSTASIVRGAAAIAWLTSLGNPARLVAHDGTVHALGGWPAEPGALRELVTAGTGANTATPTATSTVVPAGAPRG
jgi:thiamine biosynthesis lipoprotein